MITSALIKNLSESSLKGEITFPEVVNKLIDEGVESYRVDFVRKETTYYMPDGQFLVSSLSLQDHPIAMNFDAAGVQSAIKASQRNEIKYQQFISRALDAGVTSYVVYLHGKKVVYFGRKGESHCENFIQ